MPSCWRWHGSEWWWDRAFATVVPVLSAIPRLILVAKNTESQTFRRAISCYFTQSWHQIRSNCSAGTQFAWQHIQSHSSTCSRVSSLLSNVSLSAVQLCFVAPCSHALIKPLQLMTSFATRARAILPDSCKASCHWLPVSGGMTNNTRAERHTISCKESNDNSLERALWFKTACMSQSEVKKGTKVLAEYRSQRSIGRHASFTRQNDTTVADSLGTQTQCDTSVLASFAPHCHWVTNPKDGWVSSLGYGLRFRHLERFCPPSLAKVPRQLATARNLHKHLSRRCNLRRVALRRYDEYNQCSLCRWHVRTHSRKNGRATAGFNHQVFGVSMRTFSNNIKRCSDKPCTTPFDVGTDIVSSQLFFWQLLQ